MSTTEVTFTPIVTAATIIGFGMGGLLDGILFHHIFQLHHMISGKLEMSSAEGIKANLFWGGLFLSWCWALTTYGIFYLWKSMASPYTPRSNQAFTGSFLVGWGLFLFIEGSVVHLLLRLHHVIEDWPRNEEFIVDLILVGIGCTMMIAGKIVVSRAKRTFYADMLKKVNQWDPMARPQCLPPYQEYH
jgi:uncharacterized membrane protein